MPFDQSAITGVNPPTTDRDGIHLSWTSTAPAGTWFQVYRNSRLAASTQRPYAVLPASSGDAHFDVGTVGPGEQYTDFSASLSPPKNRVLLTWEGGAFLDPLGQGDVAGFKVFGVDSPGGYGDGGYGAGGYGGGSIDFSAPLATVPVYSDPGATDGYGMGGYGAGGYGSAGASYSWESDPLWSGTWSFAVAAFDREQELGAIQTATITLAVPPREPGWRRPQPRLSYQVLGYGSGGYGAGGYGDPVVALSWLPSPG